MKIIVREIFQDKITGTHYQAGDIIDIPEPERCESILAKKLGDKYVSKGKTGAKNKQ